MLRKASITPYFFRLIKIRITGLLCFEEKESIKDTPKKIHNMGEVLHGKVIRSDLPEADFIQYLKDRYNLRSIIYIHNKKKSQYLENIQLLGKKLNIQLETRYSISGKYPCNYKTVIKILEFMADKKNHPVLIHCHGGENRTGMICGIIRKKQGWSIQQIFDEYIEYIPVNKKFRLTNIINMVWIKNFIRKKMDLIKDLDFLNISNHKD